MRTYKVVVSGRNYLLPCDGEPQKVGFSQAFYIRAATEEQARQEAAGRIARDPALVQNALNGSADPFRVVIESVRRAGPFHLFTGRPRPRQFFLEKGEGEADGKTAGSQH